MVKVTSFHLVLNSAFRFEFGVDLCRYRAGRVCGSRITSSGGSAGEQDAQRQLKYVFHSSGQRQAEPRPPDNPKGYEMISTPDNSEAGGRCAPALGSASDIHARARIMEREIAQMTEAEKRVLGEQVAELMRFFNMQPNDKVSSGDEPR